VKSDKYSLLHAAPGMSGQSGERRNPFFFEKKNQKTSISLGSLYPERPQPKESKVFCFFFSRKEALAFAMLPSPDCPGPACCGLAGR
jgi:hypothetical protein